MTTEADSAETRSSTLPSATMPVTEQPPLMQLTSRIRMVRADMSQMIDDLMRAQESTLDRMIGAVPKSYSTNNTKQASQYSGQFGELESAVIELENMSQLMIYDVRTQVHQLTKVA